MTNAEKIAQGIMEAAKIYEQTNDAFDLVKKVSELYEVIDDCDRCIYSNDFPTCGSRCGTGKDAWLRSEATDEDGAI